MAPHSSPPTIDQFGHAPLFFEIAWEVCNQIGGIYTVIRTKAPAMLSRWQERYFLIGPYNESSAAIEFEPTPPPGVIQPAIAYLKSIGITVHTGRWLITGRPNVVLIDYRGVDLGRAKYLVWKDHGVDLPDHDSEINDTVAFGFATHEFFHALTQSTPGRAIVAHFHEWMAGVAIPRIAHTQLPVSTVFTTHATLLGRYIASDNPNFYRDLHHIDPDTTARHYNIYPRFALERLAARCATVFSTISEVTARETEQFLGRTPEFILPNGLNIQRFTALHEFQNLHLKFKEKIHEFTMGHFFQSYTFDLDRTIYLFTSGRYEYRNKGMEVFIEALYRLNLMLKEIPHPPTVVAFIITRGGTRHINVSTLQSHLMFEDLKKICNEVETNMGQRLLSAVVRGHLPSYEELFPDEFETRMKRAMHNLKTNRLPPIVTHDMIDDAKDPILQHLRHRRLFNAPNDPVKVVFHPDFMTATNPLFGLDYDQFVRGCHLGVFPSSYEPWGYTPLECIALGLPAVTTDLSGFGTFVRRHVPDVTERGIYVLDRSTKSANESINALAEYLVRFVQLTRRERIELRNRAERLTDMFDWTSLSSHYHAAAEEALNRLPRAHA
jgi:glycogen(starch) synthase